MELHLSSSSSPLRRCAARTPMEPEIVGDYDYEMCSSPPSSPRPHHLNVSSLATRLPQAMMVTAPDRLASTPYVGGMPAQSHWPSWQHQKPPPPPPTEARKRALDHEACDSSQNKRAALQEQQQQWRLFADGERQRY